MTLDDVVVVTLVDVDVELLLEVLVVVVAPATEVEVVELVDVEVVDVVPIPVLVVLELVDVVVVVTTGAGFDVHRRVTAFLNTQVMIAVAQSSPIRSDCRRRMGGEPTS
ncbi:MAG TPA: hypothetical protein VLU24_05245, partial [Mycobacterium sp.]|nr:hypothetical protein [Mycobacterium sp.]